jgi:integrase
MRRATGSIRQRSPGSYELRYSLGIDPATGKRKIATATFKGSQKDAERELRRLLRSLDTGEAIEPNKLVARDWFQQWLKMVRPELSPLTHRLYDQSVRLYLAPAFGNLPLVKLTPAHIQAAYSALAEGGRRDGRGGPLAATTRRLIHRVLTACLNRALELQLIGRNPALVLRRRLPKVDRVEMAILSPEQTRQVLGVTRGTELYPPVLIALATGARRGEISALRWRNVDLDRGEVLIAESAREMKGRDVTVGSTKTGKTRRVTLPTFATEELHAWKREQAEQLLRVGVRQSGDTPVCTRPDGERVTPNMLTDRFRDLAKRLGLPVHFHSLRHTHASQLLLAGAHPRTMQERLGHSSVALTLDVYSHVTERLRDDAADKIDAVLRGTR